MDQAAFDQLYTSTPDPYGVLERWYEARKLSLVMASLPRPRYRHAFEPACGIGELTVSLATRCERVLASDFSARALQAAQVRTRELPNVQLALQDLPGQWPRPDGGFDLIVLSELGYFLDAQAMRGVARCCEQTLRADGTLLACHWKHDFDDRQLSTAFVHGTLAALGWAGFAFYEDADFRLDVWERDARSVAEREGIWRPAAC